MINNRTDVKNWTCSKVLLNESFLLWYLSVATPTVICQYSGCNLLYGPLTFEALCCQKGWSLGLEPDWLIGAYPGFCSIKQLEVFLLPQDVMLVHRRSLPCNLLGFPQQFAGTHLYTWVERGTVRVKCLAQEHNTMSPARAQTQTARSGVEHTNHEATVPPTAAKKSCNLFSSLLTFTADV